MPIPVLCPGCKARFNVSDQYAGKKGPCPKCKTIITIPAAAPAVQEDVKIHVPEEYAAGGKDTKGRAITKPISRQEVKVKPAQVAAGVATAVVVLAVAFLSRKMSNQVPLAVFGLAILSPMLTAAGYAFLRDDELEPYRGRSLWTRAGICALVYALLWGFYAVLKSYQLLTGDMWEWLYAAPGFIVIGAVAAYACFDLDFGSASLHYTFFLLVTLFLRWAMGMEAVWKSAGTTAVRNATGF